MKIELKIEASKGKGKFGKMATYIMPDYYCFNKPRKATGWNKQELQESINNILRKWYQPKLFVYLIDDHNIVSNNEKNALTEYWRVCRRSDIGKMFEVKSDSTTGEDKMN